MSQQVVPDIMNDHAVAWLVVIPICSLETIMCLCAIASRSHWKCPDVLLFSFVFIQLLYLMIPMLIYTINIKRGNEVSIAACRLVVWCVLSFRIMMSLHMTYLAMDRVWILKWPRAYHLHNTNRQSCKNSIFMWLFGMAMGAIGLSNWRESEVALYLKCGLVLYTPNYVYSLCVIIIILGSLVLGVMCVGTLVVDTIRTQQNESNIPTIIIEDEIGKKTQTVKIVKEEQNRQVNKIVCMIFSVYYVISVLPFVIVNLYSLANAVTTWMPIVIQWCTLIGYVINPILMGVVCDRYRKGYIRCLGNLGCLMVEKSERDRFVPRQETLDSLDNVPPTENKIEFHTSICDVSDTWEEEEVKTGLVLQQSLSGLNQMNSLIIPNDDGFVVVDQEEYEKDESTFENEAYENEKEVKGHTSHTKNNRNSHDLTSRASGNRQSRDNHRRHKRKSSNDEKIRRAKERYRKSKQSSNQNDTEESRIQSSENDPIDHNEIDVTHMETYTSISPGSQQTEELQTDMTADVGSSSLYDIPEEILPSYNGLVGIIKSNQSKQSTTTKSKTDIQTKELRQIKSDTQQMDNKKGMLPSIDGYLSSSENDTSVKISAREMREKFRESRMEANVNNSSSSTNSDNVIFV
ncbi:uncharacterized protein [Antedon mediterranea]|uniref:uncharacterized protein n=1 Tax=Antedon mediterranea TaxID=105859 RepID=UPI003AF55057